MTSPNLATSPFPAGGRAPHRTAGRGTARRWVERALRAVSYVACALVILGFSTFAYDQATTASESLQHQISNAERADPPSAGEKAREHRHGAVHEAIDDANDGLLKPFALIVTSVNPWVNRGVPALMALLVYGFGLGYVASFARGRFMH